MAAWGKEHGTDGKVSSGRNQVIYTGLLEGPSLTHAKPSGPTLVLILHFQCCNIVPEIWTYCKLVANSFAYCDFFIFDELLMKFFLIHRWECLPIPQELSQRWVPIKSKSVVLMYCVMYCFLSAALLLRYLGCGSVTGQWSDCASSWKPKIQKVLPLYVFVLLFVVKHAVFLIFHIHRE